MELAEKNFDRLLRRIRRVAAKDMCVIRQGKDSYGLTGFVVINSYYNRIDAGENYTLDIFDLAKMFEVDVRDFFDDEELERILQSNNFFTGKIADYEKMERYNKLRMAAQWMMSHSLEVAATSTMNEGRNGIVVVDIRRLASLRGEELRVFAAMNAIADAVYFSGLKDDVIRISFAVDDMNSVVKPLEAL